MPDVQISPVALLLTDVINPMDFAGAQALLPPALVAARRIAFLRKRARECAVPVIYVNDNFDCWNLGFRDLGFAGDICVLITANDTSMRGFDVIVPADCIASERAEDNVHALRQMARILKADFSQSEDLYLGRRRASTRPKQSA
jgi:nicotinamidase-related amidase